MSLSISKVNVKGSQPAEVRNWDRAILASPSGAVGGDRGRKMGEGGSGNKRAVHSHTQGCEATLQGSARDGPSRLLAVLD